MKPYFRSSMCQLGDKLMTFSKAHRHAHAHTTTHLDKYILGSVGKDSSCPAGYAQADKANCGAAARSAGVAAGANNKNTEWLEGSWSHVPVGCSINAVALADATTGAGSWKPHWNTKSSGKNDGNYRVVCERTGRKWLWLCLSVLIVTRAYINISTHSSVYVGIYLHKHLSVHALIFHVCQTIRPNHNFIE